MVSLNCLQQAVWARLPQRSCCKGGSLKRPRDESGRYQEWRAYPRASRLQENRPDANGLQLQQEQVGSFAICYSGCQHSRCQKRSMTVISVPGIPHLQRLLYWEADGEASMPSRTCCREYSCLQNATRAPDTVG